MHCPKHAEFYSKNKFEGLVQLVGFIIRIYHDAWSPERQIHEHLFDYFPVWQLDSLPQMLDFCKICHNKS